ncbi:tetratricopeptide repeat protein [Rubrobacter tropicus]|uniref:Tetratricopeptide repeat protein n=1 Tax=Rubrobacter tropicus TaxID=2653851 RepID=A0A6G8QD11_9ACTN|nr:FxSxx-COOH system tetratricopeptide repeat protein [Rubrobacter tropicus]QIN84281.1 tetratricopeptide repeat protein [Rubrobacter tropicus]
MSGQQGPHQHGQGDYWAQADRGSTAIVNVIRYEHVRPQEPDPALLEDCRALLEDLPLDHVPAAAPPPPGSKEPPIDPNPLFIGREEDLKALAAEVKASSTAAGPVKTVCVSGIGGVGKTQLAGEFAHRYGRFFCGGVYWLNLSRPDAAAEEIANCGGAGAMDLRGDFDRLPLNDKVRAVKAAWLNELPRLLVLDNCEDAEALRACRPTTGGCRVLLTSRGVFGDPALAVVALELEVLDREQSVELLRSRCPGLELEEDDLVAVAKELGDLPLALDLAGRFLYEYRDIVSPSGYVEQLRAVEPVNHPSLRRTEGYSPTDHELDVGRTFVVSYQRLDQEDPTDRLAIRLLARAARFAPGEPIERDLLLATLGDSNGSDEPTEGASDAYRRIDALRRLTGLGLVRESEAGLVSMHRLVASFARREVEDGEAQDDVVRAVAREAIDAAEANRPSVLTRLLPHLRHVTGVLEDRQDETAYMARFALGASFLKLGSYAEAVPLLEGAVKYNTAHSGPTAWVTMRQRSDLGVAMNRSGDIDGALEVFNAVLTDQERELGPNHIDVASTLNNIGALLRDQGRFDEVLPIYERALDIRMNALGREHRDTAESLHNMGALMMDLEHYEEAWPFLGAALEINENVMGRDHLDNVGPLLKMGWLLRRAGDLNRARTFYERALRIRENELGPEHSHVGATLHDLGSLLAERGSHDEARPYLERALQISLDTNGEDHAATGMRLDSLAEVLMAQGDLESALSLYRRGLAVAERILGDGDPQTAQCFGNVANVLVLQGRYPEARPPLERALAIFEGTLGEVHPATARALDSLANVLSAQKLFEEARPLYERSRNIRLQIFGPQHPETATSENNLANLLREQGKIDEALTHQERAVAAFRDTLGDHHPNTSTSLHHLAALLRMQGRDEEARPYLVRAFAAAEAVFGAGHPFTQRVRQDLEDLDFG